MEFKIAPYSEKDKMQVRELTQCWNVGDVIFNLYKVTRFIGGGGYGQVYQLKHQGWNIDLALKIPLPKLWQPPGV